MSSLQAQLENIKNTISGFSQQSGDDYSASYGRARSSRGPYEAFGRTASATRSRSAERNLDQIQKIIEKLAHEKAEASACSGLDSGVPGCGLPKQFDGHDSEFVGVCYKNKCDVFRVTDRRTGKKSLLAQTIELPRETVDGIQDLFNDECEKCF